MHSQLNNREHSWNILLMNKYVGESEGNLYRALKVVESMSPCVLWLDEFEKAIGGESDSSINQRLIGIFLTWMQEREADVFIVATVNNVSKLPADYCDEVDSTKYITLIYLKVKREKI